MMNEHSRKWFKPLVAVLLAGSMVMFSGCGKDDDEVAPAATTISYTDYKNNTRTAKLSPGAAEYHANVGYGETLFDSADNKCQHCHNELYDTWKSSMHAKSWTDGIFQYKYQDYLRLQISKIGAVGATATYGMNTITGVAVSGTTSSSSTTRVAGGSGKVCIKCHAPGAFYAGDFNITVERIADAGTYTDVNTSALAALKLEHQSNYSTGYSTNADLSFKTTDVTKPTAVVSVGKDGALYKATYHIGHVANREGINCATCHSIESIRLMSAAGDTNSTRDGGTYKLKNAIKYGPIGAIRADLNASDVITYDVNSTNKLMNGFFSLVGPDVYSDVNATPKTAAEFNSTTGKSSDGRYAFRGITKNVAGGDTHYTGGPFYGPYGITGTNNSNSDDDTNRTALALSKTGENNYTAHDNHFSKHGKALCLSCHQRSAGAKDPTQGENQMELCSTWNAMSRDGVHNNYADTASSPKCQKCHMPRINADYVLHQWGQPKTVFEDKDLLTDFFSNNADSNVTGNGPVDIKYNPVRGKWMNDHGFIGANSQTGANWKAKIASGFTADVSANIASNVLTVTTTLENKTAHMFPGAHPMRRVLTRVIVTDDKNTTLEYNVTEAKGKSSLATIENSVVTSTGAAVKDGGDTTYASAVTVTYDAGRVITISGLSKLGTTDTAVVSQEFNTSTKEIAAADDTAKSLKVEGNTTKGTAFVSTIGDSNATKHFTRVYGRETGQTYDGVKMVRPGFDSSTGLFDNRLVPNEKETYTIKYDVTGKAGVKVTYKVYYMLKGANGQFPTDSTTGFLDATVNSTKKFAITEVFTKSVNP